MRRKDKEIVDSVVIEAIFNSASLIRFGFINDRRVEVVPAVFSHNNGQIIVEKEIFSGSVSFEAHVCAGIKKGEKICSYSTKYMSVFGRGNLSGLELSIESISAKASAMTVADIPAKTSPTGISKQFFDYSLTDTLYLGLPDNDDVYVVPVNHVVWNGAIYFHSAKEGRKMELLRNLSEIIIEGELFDGGLICCQRKVKPAIIEQPEEKVAAMSAIARKFSGGDFTFTPESLNKIEIIKL